MPESLPDILAKALLDALDEDSVPDWVVHETAVPAVLAALTVEPDVRITDDGADSPFWDVAVPVYNRFAVWPEGLDTDGNFIDAAAATPNDVERAARVLLSVAAEMRKHSAWTEAGDE